MSRRQHFAASGQHLSALRTRPLAQQWRRRRRKVTWSLCVLPMTSSLGSSIDKRPSDSSRNPRTIRAVWPGTASDKTRLIEFGAMRTRIDETRDGKPESFNFWLHAHQRKTRKGWFTVLRQTMRQSGRRKFSGANRTETTLARPRPGGGAYLRSVVTGTTATTGAMNGPALGAFRNAIALTWR